MLVGHACKTTMIKGEQRKNPNIKLDRCHKGEERNMRNGKWYIRGSNRKQIQKENAGYLFIFQMPIQIRQLSRCQIKSCNFFGGLVVFIFFWRFGC